jgi:uncharacterized membrane protein
MPNPIKPTIKTEILPLLFIIISAIASFYFYAHFPERVPIHWNFQGQADNYGSPFFAAFFFPALLVFLYILFLTIPYADPKRDRYSEFTGVYHIFKGMIIFIMAAIYFIASLNGLGFNIPIGLFVPSLIGLMFIVMGALMPRIKPNWFMGIRTPWTMSNEEVWRKTHVFGGKVFILSGILFALTPFFPASFRAPAFIAFIVFMLFGTIGYSYYAYREEGKKK